MSDRYPDELRYTREHEWLRLDQPAGGAPGSEAPAARVGITHHAQEALGDVVYVELPAEGAEVQAGRPFGVVESVKSVSDLYAPVTGRVLAVNGRLADQPELVNQDPYGEGWMIRLQLADPAELDALLDAAAYRAFVEAGA
jgi:glycine cleavage system H protein